MLSLEILEETMRDLEGIPAIPENWEKRKPPLEKLDALFGEPASENNPVLGEFYRRRCRRAIAEIRAWNKPEVRLWKLYSSGIVVKDAAGKVTAFDLNDGCDSGGERRTRLLLGSDLAAEFADLIDTALYTHGHLDHLGLAATDALLARGKEVIAPEDAIRNWLLAGAIPAENCNRRDLRCYCGVQRTAGARNIPNAAYWMTFAPGVTLFVRGDIYFGEDFLPVLDRIESERRRIDCATISPFAQSGPDPVTELSRRFHCGFVPIHEWEFGHRLPLGTAGRATQTYADLFRSFRMPGEQGKCAILGWGESIPLAKAAESVRFESDTTTKEVFA